MYEYMHIKTQCNIVLNQSTNLLCVQQCPRIGTHIKANNTALLNS